MTRRFLKLSTDRRVDLELVRHLDARTSNSVHRDHRVITKDRRVRNEADIGWCAAGSNERSWIWWTLAQ